MADVTVAHYDLNIRGGGEAVCMNVLDALQDEHDLSLLTAADVTDWDGLNDYFGTDVREIPIRTLRIGGLDFAAVVEEAERIGYFTSLFQHTVFNRYCRRAGSEADLLVSTWNELSVDTDSVQYVHFPRLYREMNPTEEYEDRWAARTVVNAARAVARRIAGYDEAAVRQATLLANSTWTAGHVEECYGTSPAVLNPPIDTTGLSPSPPWKEREDGFVFLSRIAPEKNVPWLIEILREVRKRGHDVHFHVIGPKDSGTPEHFATVESLAREHDFVTLEGPMYGEDLHRMLRRHRYGINGARSEQFGIAIAEMVAAGMIPFVPNSGGQREIVNENPAVMFDTTAEAAEKIATVVSDRQRAERIRAGFPDIEAKYGTEVFGERIRTVVDERLER
jgi:glycosyltransferase involved in cell wall biosynthesis